MARSTILVIDDEPNILTTVRRSLELEGYSVEVAGGAAPGLAKLVEHDVDLVLLDVMMPGETGLEVLPKLRAAKPETTVVMMSGNATIETAVQATKAGAYDFIEKPLSGDKLLITVQNALAYARLRDEHARLRGRTQADFAMIGKGAAMRESLLAAIDAAFGDTFRIIGDETPRTYTPARGAYMYGVSYYWSTQDPYRNPESFAQLQQLASAVEPHF